MLLEKRPNTAIQAVSPCIFGLASVLGCEIFTNTIQEGERYQPPKGLVSHYQEDKAILPQKVESVLIACDGEFVLI